MHLEATDTWIEHRTWSLAQASPGRHLSIVPRVPQSRGTDNVVTQHVASSLVRSVLCGFLLLDARDSGELHNFGGDVVEALIELSAAEVRVVLDLILDLLDHGPKRW
jgi:hypothetical protein